MTTEPATWEEYQQIVGRSNRLNYENDRRAGLVVLGDRITQNSLQSALWLNYL